MLRHHALASGLREERKWGVPCYTLEGKNVLIVAALKDCAFISFLKGALLSDPQGLLVSPGAHSQAARYLKFTNVQSIISQEASIKSYITEAIEIERSGRKVDFKTEPEALPDELLRAFNEDPAFASAFQALTPGRQRGYLIHFGQPKKPETRINRINKYKEQIMQGLGMHDGYSK